MRSRLGVNVIGSPPEDWLDDCRRVEALGIDEISVADHLVTGAKSPLVALAAAAAATERVTLSTMVLNNLLRHPAELAAEAALLGELSGGRFTLGMGSGYARAEHDAIGIPLPPVGERLDRLEEAIAVLHALLRGEEVTSVGRHYAISGHRTSPVPSTPVPILVGGGSVRVMEIAARHADVVGFTGFSVRGGGPALTHFSAEGLDQRIALVQDLAGDRAAEVRYQVLVQEVRVTDDREQTAAEVAAAWTADGQAVTAEGVLECPFLFLGTATEVATQMQARTDRWGIETWTAFSGRPTDPSLDQLGEIAAALAGATA